MSQATLQFPSLALLVDFQMITHTFHVQLDTVERTLTGIFSDADIELAKRGFQAIVKS